MLIGDQLPVVAVGGVIHKTVGIAAAARGFPVKVEIDILQVLILQGIGSPLRGRLIAQRGRTMPVPHHELVIHLLVNGIDLVLQSGYQGLNVDLIRPVDCEERTLEHIPVGSNHVKFVVAQVIVIDAFILYDAGSGNSRVNTLIG